MLSSIVNRTLTICTFSDIFWNLEVASFRDDLSSGYFQTFTEFKKKQKDKDSGLQHIQG